MQADAGNQNGSNWYQCQKVSCASQSRLDYGPLVLAEQFFDAPQRDRIHVPGVAGNVSHALDTAVMRRMESMIHARRQPQRHVTAVAMPLDQLRRSQQVFQCVRKALDLEELGVLNRAQGTDDCIAGADDNIWIAIDRPCALSQLAREAIVHASELALFGLAKIQ